MSNLTERQTSPRKTICDECAFHVLVNNCMQCTHPLELEVNCYKVTFCNSFQPAEEVDSPCVSFNDEN
ncbi:MAG: hypothetical protein WBA41_00385 [Rivularia sp. (in: cyanobacteria)]